METLKITTFGEFSISYGDKVITEQTKRSKKMWTLLQFMIANHNRTISQTELINLLWGNKSSENPVGALKTSLHRLRNCLAELGLPEGQDIIVNSMGTYAFNNRLECEIDFDKFEALYKKSVAAQSEKEKTNLYLAAIDLYRGDFLNRSREDSWVAPLASYYHSLYVRIVRETIETMYKHRYFGDLLTICRKALVVEQLDDFIHYYYIKALFETGEKAAAKNHYAYVMDLFYNKHGINPSPEFVSLYEQTVKDDRSYNVNFGILKGQLDDMSDESGAFYCEFPFFKHVYQLEVRDAVRSDRPTHLCLITAVSKAQEELEPKMLNRVTGKLSDCIKNSLRSRDVFSRYSASQFVMLLTNTTKEQAEMVLNRILKKFKKENPKLNCTLLYKFDKVGKTVPADENNAR
ncbi:MAG: winged helix-turn-helix domain-containing protein [Ruminiclostridium sp.]|nr:winged helix-turn-helix domain-containing protein [Ruminiclostridium sp.]